VLHDRRPSAAMRPDLVGTLVTTAVNSFDLPRLVGVGVDVVDLVEFRHNMHVGGERWLRKVFTDVEIDDSVDRPDKADRLGTRFAAKEAVAKALGTGFRDGVSARTIEIRAELEGAPTVRLLAPASDVARALNVESLLVSMSRDGGCAVAVAWALSDD